MHQPVRPVIALCTQRSRTPRGFTLIEVLVVLGILMLLAALAVIGIQGVSESSSKRQTKILLGNAASMLAEYETATGLRRQPAYVWKGSITSPARHNIPADGALNVWQDYDPAALGNQGLPCPGDVKPYTPMPDLATALPPERKQRTDSAPVRNTQIVLYTLSSGVPNNKTALGNVPQDQKMGLPMDIAGTPLDEMRLPVLLDAWENPIIFVPASGLRGVMIGERTGAASPFPQYVITSVKPYLMGDLPNGTLAPGARPFFASAGPDGVFTQHPGDDGVLGNADDVGGGDDNMYSFEN